MNDGVNPKEVAATLDKKPRLDLLEHPAEIAIAQALATGAAKYGKKNFRHGGPIKASVYGGAVRRHIGAWLNGEDIDPDSGLSHLAHVGASIHVLLGAMEAGTFEDDRGPQPPVERPPLPPLPIVECLECGLPQPGPHRGTCSQSAARGGPGFGSLVRGEV